MSGSLRKQFETIAISEENKRPTGIFDLPLDIRQIIYHEVLPQEPYLAVDKLHWDTDRESRIEEIGYKGWKEEQEQRTFQAACQTCPQIDAELNAWAEKKKYGRRFIITPDSKKLPDNIEYDKLWSINIVIDHYNLNHPFLDVVERSLIDLMLNIQAFVKVLQGYKKLRHVWIEFQDVEWEFGRGDPHWCCEVDDDQMNWGSPLETLLRAEVPIVTYLLQPLLELPPCAMAGIDLLNGISDVADVESTEGLPSPFGYEYMEELIDTVEGWLMGGREKPSPAWLTHVPKDYSMRPNCPHCSIGENCNS
ncbi:hypothetical protein LTR10_007473 [Elasticomyces elasticus]|nr:hypothetical protein LTR10_007473 [Elasticomyces elasticus]KAK4979280.1 hypothetical protein LTR42_001783 [Elasticomyces elasticus]